mmetsp:Transcript_14153/g.38878  ORF Transcript_14153/g.38878 Transcript_14153/m.38878 type:complete len:220 (-) Transcript_14153:425-1084(-)
MLWRWNIMLRLRRCLQSVCVGRCHHVAMRLELRPPWSWRQHFRSESRSRSVLGMTFHRSMSRSTQRGRFLLPILSPGRDVDDVKFLGEALKIIPEPFLDAVALPQPGRRVFRVHRMDLVRDERLGSNVGDMRIPRGFRLGEVRSGRIHACLDAREAHPCPVLVANREAARGLAGARRGLFYPRAREKTQHRRQEAQHQCGDGLASEPRGEPRQHRQQAK